MIKKHSDVKIIDPGKEHIVPILPNQNFSLFLSGFSPKVHFSSPFFQLASTTIYEKYTAFHFKQTKDLSNWSKVSKVFLGEIFFNIVNVCDNSQFGNLLVYLSSATHNDLITVINPDKTNLKIFPSNTIEVVIYNHHYSSDWGTTVISGFNGLKFEKIASQKIDPSIVLLENNVNNNYVAYPRARMLANPLPIFEHHYWFRLDQSCVRNIINLPNGNYQAGKLIFDTKESEVDFKVLNIILNIRGSKNQKINNLSKAPLAQKMRVLKPSLSQHCGRPKNSILIQNIVLNKKTDSELNSQNILYVN